MDGRKKIIGFLCGVILLELVISVLLFNMVPVLSIAASLGIIYTLIKYSKPTVGKTGDKKGSANSDLDNSDVSIKKIAFILVGPFIILAIVGTYLMYILAK